MIIRALITSKRNDFSMRSNCELMGYSKNYYFTKLYGASILG